MTDPRPDYDSSAPSEGSPTLQAARDRKGEADTTVTEEADTPVAHWDPETASEIAALISSTLLLGAAKVQSSGHPAAARNYLEAIVELVMFGPPATERRA